MSVPSCPYCGADSVLINGAQLYGHRPDLADKRFYRCDPCRAWVGCHPGTTTPLGRLANAELRQAKSAAHAVFDPIWRTAPKTERKRARGDAYSWLAEQLGIRKAECHIGMFDVDMCERVVEVCRSRRAAA